uniref:uncharacterized protein isoform X2 n=1 Tax=Myxine glutinosa TaxID=7769 RepID=UPI0035902F03
MLESDTDSDSDTDTEYENTSQGIQQGQTDISECDYADSFSKVVVEGLEPLDHPSDSRESSTLKDNSPTFSSSSHDSNRKQHARPQRRMLSHYLQHSNFMFLGNRRKMGKPSQHLVTAYQKAAMNGLFRYIKTLKEKRCLSQMYELLGSSHDNSSDDEEKGRFVDQESIFSSDDCSCCREAVAGHDGQTAVDIEHDEIKVVDTDVFVLKRSVESDITHLEHQEDNQLIV